MRTVALIQARVSSSRLQAKVLADICGRVAISHLLTRVAQAETLDRIVVATGDAPANEPLVSLCQSEGWDVYIGSEDNVLQRLCGAARYADADVVVRLTGDCPLHSGAEIDRVVRFLHDGHYQYASNCHPPQLPDGLDTEVLSRQMLGWLAFEATAGADREHATPLARRALSRFWWRSLGHMPDLSQWRLTLDTMEDLAVLRAIMAALGPDCDWRQAVAWLGEHPEVAALSQGTSRNSGYLQQVKGEHDVS